MKTDPSMPGDSMPGDIADLPVASGTRPRCPGCLGSRCTRIHVIEAQAAADHIIPPHRSPLRNQRLAERLRELWAAEHVEVYECAACEMGFAWPFLAGTAEIYNLFGNGAQHYPAHRFEFDEVLRDLTARGGVRRLLEVGAGSGAFLARVAGAGLAADLVATEVDDSALVRLRARSGLEVFAGGVQELVASASASEPFDVVCLFQVLEHLGSIPETFEALAQLTAPGGDLWIGVPNWQRVKVQERLTGYLDMPPVHIGRWTPQAVDSVARRHGFELLEDRPERQSAAAALWGLAKYRLEARSRRRTGPVARVETISYRPVRGALKRALAGWDLLALAPHTGRIPPRSRLYRLRRTD